MISTAVKRTILRKRYNSRGFTLIEVIATISIMVIMIGLVTVGSRRAVDNREADSTAREFMALLDTARNKAFASGGAKVVITKDAATQDLNITLRDAKDTRSYASMKVPNTLGFGVSPGITTINYTKAGTPVTTSDVTFTIQAQSTRKKILIIVSKGSGSIARKDG